MEHTYTRFHPSLATQKGRTMDLNEAKKTAAALFKDAAVTLRKDGISHRILRPLTDAEKKLRTPGTDIVTEPYDRETADVKLASGEIVKRKAYDAAHCLNLTRDGLVVLGAGSSWKAAIRYAARPVLEAQQEREKKRAEKRDADAAEFQLQARRFTDFLYEKFASEFEVYLKQFEPIADAAPIAALDTPPPVAPADGPPTTPAP